MKEMKDHILRLEKDLKASEQRSLEMLKKMNFSLNPNEKNLSKANSPF